MNFGMLALFMVVLADGIAGALVTRALRHPAPRIRTMSLAASYALIAGLLIVFLTPSTVGGTTWQWPAYNAHLPVSLVTITVICIVKLHKRSVLPAFRQPDAP
ncbi:MAG: hypothetical protein ACRD0P_00425 [Stackebrandtia sp.]